MTVAEDGTFISEIRPWSGLPVQEAEPHILQDLQVRGLLLGTESRMQPSPTCMHCHAPLMNLSHSTWFLRTSAFEDRLLKLNQQVSWTPANAKTGWFSSKLEKRFDWAIARERYWGTPLPVWECQSCHHQLAAGSVAELSKLSKRDLSGMDLHRPFIDEVHIGCPQCSGVMKRISEVLDFWFDAGGMPVAQSHFPYADRAAFREQFPADLVCEPAEEAGGWFYALHTISALLFDSMAFKNVICLGPALDANGQKLTRSSSKGLDPWEVLNSHGSDAFRWYLYSTGSPSLEHRVTPELVGTALNSFILPLWDIYSFFVRQANLDRWSPGSRSMEAAGRDHSTDSQPEKGPGPDLIALDHWLRSELHALVRDVANSLEAYDVPSAACLIQSFLGDTLWYQRQTRRRFWLKEPSGEKELAYVVLHEVLAALSKLLAPLVPFLAEVLYQNLVRSQDAFAPESVHLCSWPGYSPEAIDETCRQEVRRAMQLASLGHTARSQAGIKAHQPLREIAFASASKEDRNAIEHFAGLLANELNVKKVRWLDSPEEALSFALKPLANQLEKKYAGIYPELSREIQELDPSTSASLLANGEPLIVEVAGQRLLIQPDEMELVRTARRGLAVAFEGTSLASLDLEITPDLKQEGLAGEFISHILELRRQAGLETFEWIWIHISGTPGLWRAIQENQELVLGETRAAGLSQGQVPEDAILAEAWFDGEWMKAGIQRQELASSEAGPAVG
jgi:isoleucyl-tRNA synthetase